MLAAVAGSNESREESGWGRLVVYRNDADSEWVSVDSVARRSVWDAILLKASLLSRGLRAAVHAYNASSRGVSFDKPSNGKSSKL